VSKAANRKSAECSGGEWVALVTLGFRPERNGGRAHRVPLWQPDAPDPEHVVDVDNKSEAGGEDEHAGGGGAEWHRYKCGQGGDEGGKRKRFHGVGSIDCGHCTAKIHLRYGPVGCGPVGPVGG